MLTYIILALLVGILVIFFFRPKGEIGFNNLSVTDLKNLIKDKNTVLIDVRTKSEISQGKIGKPLEIELGPRMQHKMSNLDKNKKYIVYCRSGKRSAMASNMMTKMGFKDVNNLQGGYLAFQASK